MQIQAKSAINRQHDRNAGGQIRFHTAKIIMVGFAYELHAGASMAGFVAGTDREQMTLFPARLDDYVAEDNPVRAVDVFVDGLDLDKLGFIRVQPLDLGRPGYDPRMMLKLYIYGYLNRVPSSRRLERECQRNIEVIWLTGQLAPDFKTIADFRNADGKAIAERSAVLLLPCAVNSIC